MYSKEILSPGSVKRIAVTAEAGALKNSWNNVTAIVIEVAIKLR